MAANGKLMQVVRADVTEVTSGQSHEESARSGRVCSREEARLADLRKRGRVSQRRVVDEVKGGREDASWGPIRPSFSLSW